MRFHPRHLRDIAENVEEGGHNGLLRMDSNHCRYVGAARTLFAFAVFLRLQDRLKPHCFVAQATVLVDLVYDKPLDLRWLQTIH